MTIGIVLVASWAARVAVGRSHLYRRLEALLGCSPGKLIFERRLAHAAQLLATAGAPRTSVHEMRQHRSRPRRHLDFRMAEEEPSMVRRDACDDFL